MDAASDAGHPVVDAAPDVAREAGPGLCCHMACGSGTFPIGVSGGASCGSPCVVGGACSYMTACGVVVTCP